MRPSTGKREVNMTDIDDTNTDSRASTENIENETSRSSRRAILGLTGAGIAGAVVMGPKIAAAADGDNVVVGGTYDGDTPTSFENDGPSDTSPGTPGGEAVVGSITGAMNGSHAVLGKTDGLGHAIAGDIPAGTDNVVGATWGRHAGNGAGAEGVNVATDIALAGPANAVKGTVTDITNGSHAILGITKGFGHAVAGVIGAADDPAEQNTVAATWGLHYGEGAAVEGDQRNATAPLAGDANAVKGLIKSEANGSHAIKGETIGVGHAIAGESFNTTEGAKAATWGRHSGPAAATEGVSIAGATPIAGPANGVKGIVADAANGSHAVLGVTAGGGHAVAGDIEADAPNTVAATWGRHKGTGAGIGGISVSGYGGEFIGGLAHVRLIQDDTAPAGAPSEGDHKMGELYVDGAGNLFLNKADGLNFTQLNDQPGTVRMLDNPERAYDSRAGKLPASSEKGKFSNDEIRVIDLTAETTFPAGAAGALLNVTVAETEDGAGPGGYLTVFSAALEDTPATSTINWFGPNQIAANGATIKVDADGKIKIFSRNMTHVIVDVTGFVM